MPFNLNFIHLDKKIQSLSIVKATTWVIFGISNMFSVYDLTNSQSDSFWVSPLMKFGLAVAFLLAGMFFLKDPKRNIYVVVSIQPPIGIFDILMIIFDLLFYWLIFGFLKQIKQ